MPTPPRRPLNPDEKLVVSDKVIFENESKRRSISFYLNNEIDDDSSSDIISLLNILRTVDSNDEVRIYLNCFGGRLDYTIQILNAIKDCAGTVVTIIDGLCISAASMIFLAGDEYIVNDFSTMMNHYYSAEMKGKGNEIEKYMEYTLKFSHKLYREIYEGFLSESELQRLFSGEDIWLDAKGIAKRLIARNLYFTKKQKKSKKDKKGHVQQQSL